MLCFVGLHCIPVSTFQVEFDLDTVTEWEQFGASTKSTVLTSNLHYIALIYIASLFRRYRLHSLSSIWTQWEQFGASTKSTMLTFTLYWSTLFPCFGVTVCTVWVRPGHSEDNLGRVQNPQCWHHTALRCHDRGLHRCGWGQPSVHPRYLPPQQNRPDFHRGWWRWMGQEYSCTLSFCTSLVGHKRVVGPNKLNSRFVVDKSVWFIHQQKKCLSVERMKLPVQVTSFALVLNAYYRSPHPSWPKLHNCWFSSLFVLLLSAVLVLAFGLTHICTTWYCSKKTHYKSTY